MRPGHTHMWVKADGFKDLITHVFDSDSEYLEEDAVFGVRPSLVRTFTPDSSGRVGDHVRHRPRQGAVAGRILSLEYQIA